MRRLRSTDGTLQHKRSARYHMGSLAANGGALHQTLRSEMAPLLAAATAAERAVDDARGAAIDAQAYEDHAEIALENIIRDTDADLGKLDRQDPTLNARATAFPDGISKEIDPESDSQLERLPALRVRIAKFDNLPGIHEALVKFDAAADFFGNAVKTTNAAEQHVDALFNAEVDTRRAIREQFESAYGRLRTYYKATPARAEEFFLREGSRRQPPPNGSTTP